MDADPRGSKEASDYLVFVNVPWTTRHDLWVLSLKLISFVWRTSSFVTISTQCGSIFIPKPSYIYKSFDTIPHHLKLKPVS